MSEQNPLRIFTNKQLFELDQSKLKQLKKEALLEFQLTDHATIKLNGFEIDKNGVLEIFEELKPNLDLHLFINKNKSLNNFLNLGKIDLFEDYNTIHKIKSLENYKEVIELKIIARLKKMVLQKVEKIEFSSYVYIEKIKHFVNKLNPALEDEVFSTVFEKIKNQIAYLEDNFSNPFSKPWGTTFHPELETYVRISYYKVLKSLPIGFKELTRKYCIWCNNLVYNAVQRTPNLQEYSTEDLILLRHAAKIGSNAHNKSGNLQFADSIKAHLNARISSSGSEPTFPWQIILYVFLFIWFIVHLSKSFNNSSNRNYGYQKEDPISQSYVTDIIYEELEKEASIEEPNSTKVKPFSLDYAGEKKKSVNPQLVSQKEHKAYTELIFNVDAFPSKTNYLTQLIPESISKKHKGNWWPIVMKFRHPKISGSTLEHRLEMDFTTEKWITTPRDYQNKKPKFTDACYLSLKKIATSNFPLKGIISRVDAESSKVLHSNSFIIQRVAANNYEVTMSPSGKKLSFDREYMSSLDPHNSLKEVDKFAIALKNIEVVNSKYLKEGNFYLLENVYGYRINKSTKKDFPNDKIIKESATLNYYITSDIDNTSYVQLKGKKVSLKYFADFISGRIKGMSMVTSTKEGSELERMTLFSSN